MGTHLFSGLRSYVHVRKHAGNVQIKDLQQTQCMCMYHIIQINDF